MKHAVNYTSTRNSKINISSAEAIMKGISEEGGLFIPEYVPNPNLPPMLSEAFIASLVDKSYPERAYEILKLMLTDFSDEEVKLCAEKAYGSNFDVSGITELVKLSDDAYMFELWHGPTAAFKDMALQILPEFLNVSAKKTRAKLNTLILVATSGDTGKAALEGFKNAENIEIAVFYPEDGVSDMQKLQMATQEGENVHVFAVKGNFDDCQNAVKAVFTDDEANKKALMAGYSFSSANSINWGRLCPQIVYYVSAYADMIKQNVISYGEKVNVSVPTGNFGNILAAFYAKDMGIPFGKLICASNANNVLTDFINTGIYDKNRKFFTTISPSMDILISSNLERLLYRLSGNSDETIAALFSTLKASGKYEVSENVKALIKEHFYGGWRDDEDTKKTIKKVFEAYNYLMDAHTAVGYAVWEEYAAKTSDKSKTIIVSTANPYKFSAAVYEALTSKKSDIKNDFELIEKLEEISKVKAPESLTAIKDKPVRFTESVAPSEIKDAVLNLLEKI